nr:probable sodium/metabolite cotransporter BASS4, chloroplastic [Ipomoea batatas]
MAATLRTTSLNLSARASLPSVRRRHYFPATRFPLPGDYSFRIQLNLPLARKYPFITVTPIRAQAKSYRGNGSENQFPEVPAKDYNWVKPILKFASDNFLPIALVCGVALGLANPSLGCLADRYHLSKFSTFGIFIISGLTLRTEEIGAAAEAWPVALFGLV